MKEATLILFLSVFFVTAEAHEKDSTLVPDSSFQLRKNSVYAELLGNAGIGLYSLNYERRFHEWKKSYPTFRVGISGFDDFFFPVLVNCVFRKNKRNHFELGFGMTLAVSRVTMRMDKDLNALTACFVYRYQKPKGRFVFRAGLTPVYYYNEDPLPSVFFFWPGISFGYAF